MKFNAPGSGPPRDGRIYALVHEQADWAEILSAFGEFDLSVADELQATIDGHLSGTRPLVLDLAFCEYLDSTILRVLVRTMRTSGWRVAIIVPRSARVRRIFEMTRLDDALAIYADRDEARQRLASCA